MRDTQFTEELQRLRTEIESLRFANAALERQMILDAEHTDSMLRAIEQQSNALREANWQLNQQNDFIQRVMNTSSTLMIILGAEGRIIRVNQRCTAELETSGQPLVGGVLDDWLGHEERSLLATKLPKLPWPVFSPLFEHVRRLGAYTAEHRLRHSDGNYRHYWLEASLQHNPQGKEEGAVVCATDITPYKLQQQELRHNENLLKEAQQIAQMGHWELAVQQGELFWSEEMYRIFEIDPASPPLTYASFLALVHHDDQSLVDQAYTTMLNDRLPYDIDYRLCFTDGRIKWVHERALTYGDDKGYPVRSLGTVQDISAQISFKEQMRLAASVFENSLNGILITDEYARILKVNRAFTEILGYTEQELFGRKINLIKSGHHDKRFYQELWAELERNGKWQGEMWDRCKNGKLIPLWQNISSVRSPDGQVINYIGVFYDLSEQKNSADHIHHLAYYDVLTDLPNRQLFYEHLGHALERAYRINQSVALLFLDLDRFKHVNDSLGHPVGDELLRVVAKRLKETLRQGDTVARLGGDEFIVLLESNSTLSDVESVANKLLTAFAKPFNVNGHKLDIGTSIGISCYPQDGEDTATLVKNADLAMYSAKERGRGNFQFYEAHLTAKAKERLFLEGELREALRRDELILHYQPQYSLADNSLIGAEALLRWHHRKRGMIPPDKFIPIAEDSGLIVSIGEWVLRSACRQAKEWLADGIGFRRMAVNLSGVQIERSDIVFLVRRALEESGLPPENLELEITETYIMRQAQRNICIMEELRDLGVSLAIDDFGTGQSSLSYLKLLPVDKLKIDRSFVMDIPQDSDDMAITQAILALGHSLHLTVLAEGVETDEQAKFLRKLACDEVQGYCYSKPLTAKSFTYLLKGISKNLTTTS